MDSLFDLLMLVLVPAVLCQDSTSTTKAHHTHHPHVHHSHSPKPTVESSENDRYNFNYDGRLHEMIIKQGHICYLMALTDAQKARVHDPFGIKGIEAAALRLIADSSAQTTVDKSTLDRFTTHDCSKAQQIITLKQN